MATLVVHGTMTWLGPAHASWWWDSWQDGGFLNALAGGLTDAGAMDDVWRVRGRPVREIAELRGHGMCEHQGHFQWGGADMPDARRGGGDLLAAYLNRIRQIAPGEPIRLVAHSHGCNVVKAASAVRALSSAVRLDRVVFLACPHFMGKGAHGPVFHHRLAPARFRKILNLHSESDTIQTATAGTWAGPFGAHLDDYSPPNAYRVEQDPLAQGVFENWRVPTADRGAAAHTAMHGMRVGYLAGRWLAGQDFRGIVNAVGARLLPVPAGDFGE